MKVKDYKMNYENSKGVHLPFELNTEYSLCGDTFDCGSDGEGESLEDTNKKVITCPRCIAVIKSCRGVKTKEK